MQIIESPANRAARNQMRHTLQHTLNVLSEPLTNHCIGLVEYALKRALKELATYNPSNNEGDIPISS